MPINYSLSLQSSNPLDETAKKKVYAHAQYSSLMTLNEFAEHIASHGSCFDRATIAAVLTKAVDCLREQLLLGNKVQLGDLGAFYCSLCSRGADSAIDFVISNIKRVKVGWEPSSYFQDLIKEASFKYVGTREAQAAARKAEKEEIETEMGNITNGSDDNNDDNNDSVEE